MSIFSLSLKIEHLIHSIVFFSKFFLLRSLHFHINSDFRIRIRIKSDYQWPRKMKAGNKRLSGKGEGNECRAIHLGGLGVCGMTHWLSMWQNMGWRAGLGNLHYLLYGRMAQPAACAQGHFPSEFPLPSTWLSLKPWSTFRIPELLKGPNLRDHPARFLHREDENPEALSWLQAKPGLENKDPTAYFVYNAPETS